MWRRLCVSVLVFGECQKVARLGPMRFILHLPVEIHPQTQTPHAHTRTHAHTHTHAHSHICTQYVSCQRAGASMPMVKAYAHAQLPRRGCLVWLIAAAFLLLSIQRNAWPARRCATSCHAHPLCFCNAVVTTLSAGPAECYLHGVDRGVSLRPGRLPGPHC